MPELIPVLKKDDIDKLVAQIAGIISSDYHGCELILIGILKGAFIFLSDLIRYITIPVKVDFICASSYGSKNVSSGNIQLTKEIDVDINNKDVLLVEDIIDTGLTLNYCIEHLKSFNPKTLRICAMINKHERREAQIRIDYTCYEAEEGFFVGYGLDYNQNYRGLPGIYRLTL